MLKPIESYLEMSNDEVTDEITEMTAGDKNELIRRLAIRLAHMTEAYNSEKNKNLKLLKATKKIKTYFDDLFRQ